MDVLEIFKNEIFRGWRKLSAEEEYILGEKARGGDLDARNALIISVLPWAYRCCCRLLPRDEAMIVAPDAAMSAVRSFVPSKGRLTTLVTIAARHCSLRYINTERWAITLPSAPVKDKARAVYAMMSLSGGKAKWKAESIETSVSSVEEDFVRYEDDRNAYLRAINAIPQRLADVLCHRASGKTLREISEQLGVTKERVRQLEVEAIRLVRRFCSNSTDESG